MVADYQRELNGDNNRRRRSWTRFWPALIVIGVLGGFLGWALMPPGRDSFDFLEGKPMIARQLLPPMEVDSFQGPGESVGATESRRYGWQERLDEIIGELESELLSKDFVKTAANKDNVWTNSKEIHIWIESGKPGPDGGIQADGSWTTITVLESLPDNLRTKLRVWLSR